MITLENKKTKQILVKTNKDAEIILNGSLGHNFKVIKTDKVEAPPETKVSLKKTKE